MNQTAEKKKAPEFNPIDFEGLSDLPKKPDIKNVFIPTWDNKPKDIKPVLSLNGTPILTYQNTSMIIALPGLGKSSICESICASFLNPAADCLGLSVDSDCEGVIYIDNERTNVDVWNGFHRTTKRAGITQGSQTNNVLIAGLRSVPRLDQRLRTIEYLLTNNPCSLLLIDGLGDLVTDSNDQIQAIDCRIWLREITVKHKVSILTTIHPNPGSTKPRGHIGSEGYRESECVLLAKAAENEIRLLTTDFEHGKNRNNSHVTAAFQWSEDLGMFVSVDPELISYSKSKGTSAKKAKTELMVLKLIPAPKALTHTDLIKAITSSKSPRLSESTGKRIINDMIDFDFIKKHEDGFYRAVL